MNSSWQRAVRAGDVESLAQQLAGGADVNAKDRYGQTGVMIAAAEGRSEVVAWLVEQGAALNHTAKFGLSALMLAALRGHAAIVRTLVDAGADTTLRGSGAPGFAGKTALDLAINRGDRDIIEILRSRSPAAASGMTDNPHFQTVGSWRAARSLLAFIPIQPKRTAGQRLISLRVHVRDHKRRDLPIEARTLEAHYGAFVFSQSRRSRDEARRLALDVAYGPDGQPGRIAGHEARIYQLGPEPPAEDIDGRSPAVVAWYAAEMFLFLASTEWDADPLVRIAEAMYA